MDKDLAAMWLENVHDRALTDKPEVRCIVDDVNKLSVWEQIAEDSPDIITLSSSCRSFSAGGLQRGWDCQDGYTLANVLLLAARFGHRCILLENVSTLRTDPSLFERLKEVLAFCGLEVVSMGTYSLSYLQPVERSRLLMVLKQHGDVMIPPTQMGDPFQMCHNEHKPTLWNKGRWMHLPDELTRDLVLDPDVLDMYLLRKHMPPQMQANMMSADRESAFEARCVRSTQVLSSGTCMAGYGNQHNIVSNNGGKYMYGSIKRTDANQARFLHAVEIIGAMGITVNAKIPRANALAHHAVGNSISESHALIALLQGLRAWRFVFPWIEPVDIPKTIHEHTQKCMTVNTMRMTWDAKWIHITRKEQSGASSAEPPSHAYDDGDSTTSGASEPIQVAGPKRRRIEIQVETDDQPEPAIIMMCDDDTTLNQIVQAEKKLHPFLRRAPGINPDARIMGEDQPVPSQFRLYPETRPEDGFSTNILIMGIDEGISLRCLPHDCLHEWTFQGEPLGNFQWSDALGARYDPFETIGFTQQVSSNIPFDWPRYPSEAQVLLVHVHNKAITQNMIETSPGEWVESVLFGEQVLMGPTSRIATVHDRYANIAPASEPVKKFSVLVIHWEDSHNQIKIVIARNGIRREHWVSRGTRLFQLVQPDPNLVVVRPHGFETPWDYPFFGPVDIQVITRVEVSDEEPSATIPFVAETPPNSVHMNLTTPNLNMGHVLAESNAAVKSTVADTLTQAPYSQDPWETSIRFQQLWEFGHVMADDEMSYICRIFENTMDAFVRGVFKWEHVSSEWKCHPQWQHIDQTKTARKSVAMLHYDDHWIAVHQDTEISAVTYRCRFQISCQIINALTSIWGLPSHTIFRQDEADKHGWCGWGAVAWSCAKMAVNPPNMNRQVASEAVKKFAEMIGPLKFREYQKKMETNSVECNSMLGLRDLFIQRMLTWPTQSAYSGRGVEDGRGTQPNLKLAGNLAALLVAHGHKDSEALQLGRSIAQQFPKQARLIPNQRDSKAYGALLQLCSEQNIKVQPTGLNTATMKLQRFFRAKQARKRQNQPIDLKQVQFHPDTFSINGKSVMPAMQWSPSHVGLAVATVDEIRPYLDKDQHLTMDTNTAVLNCWIPAGTNIAVEQKEIPVMDQDGNHAIIRVWLAHFGQKKPARNPAVGSSVKVEADETNVLVIQVFKALVDEQFWKNLKTGPAKHVMQNYFAAGEAQPVVQLWSRRWNCKGKQSSIDDADQFSLLCRVNKSHVNTWLRRSGSGTPCMFCSIKSDKSDGDESVNTHRVVWSSKTIHDTLIQLAKIPDHCGVVHRAPHSYGIRVERARFASAWQEIKGSDEPVPSQIQCKRRYLIAGAPPALTGPNLEAWSKEVDWPLRVLRSYGGGRFLVGSEDEVPSKDLVIQKHHIVCQPYAEKSTKAVPPIVTGKLNLPTEKAGPGEDMVFTNDPWAAGAIAAKEGASGPSWSKYRPTTRPDNNMQVDGSDATSEVVARQSERITAVEDQIKCLQEQLSADQKSNQTRFTQLDHNIQSMHSNLRTTLEEALKQQSANLVSTFDSLLRRSPRAESLHSGDRSRSPVMKEK
eukprot:Skav222648  [mRNA]  locus=scaffold10:497599:502317:- [translate_table: standard]